MDRQPLSEQALQRALTAIPYNIRRLRLARGLSQFRLAQAAGVTRVAVCQIEGGRIRDPRMTTLLKLARGLGVTVNDLAAWPGEDGPAATTRKKESKSVGA
jgi:transcriptional regulator with XRE-family HTH domain